MDSIWILNLGLVALLIALTAFFVGSEFAVVKVRMSRLDQLIAEGNQTAVLAKRITNNLDYYLSACQLGITVTALGLGWLGEPTVEKLLHPLFESLGLGEPLISVLSFGIAFASVTFLHVVIGELAPKTLAIQFAERMTLLFAQPLYLFGKIMFPFIWTLNGSARILLRIFGIKPAPEEAAHSQEELKIIMTHSYQSGEINQTELAFMQNVFSFDNRVAKDLMIPRTKVETVSLESTRQELIEFFGEHQFTRYPVTENHDKDHIVGYINVKEMLTALATKKEGKIQNFLKEIPIIVETTPLVEIFNLMKTKQSHIALVVDEFGGTAGIVTLEDLLEEIVGEIRDEFDEDEIDDIQEVGENHYIVQGRVLLAELNERFQLHFDDSENIDTLAGWMQAQKLDLEPGDVVTRDAFTLEVLEAEQHHVESMKLEIHPMSDLITEDVY
ncbi:transporter associated domain protein [Chryseomicrobium excrementi]|uniref:Transporter associated domain protein n=1 Tax=Chryseomicrobium excrementi TaxID=2041346 RepID=A0A2M9EZI0_9BACL|nr:hemolysin family protein [Chryseomicrobium excrementi]PJK16616.1 transporter associated domain protein [Chryseomicrobium excrementi]